MAEAALTFRDLTLGYHDHPAVHHLSGVLERGSLTAVVGANGSGKSTLMKGIAGVLHPMDGESRRAPGARIAYLPQQSELDRSFPARVFDLVSMGLWPKRGFFRRHTAEDKVNVGKGLAQVGLAGFEARPIDTLSGGQLQRALFARVLVQDAEIILLDEPFNAVDARTVRDLVALIGHWHAEKRTVVVVAHDLHLVREHFPQTLLMARRPVAWGATADVLTPENLLKARRFDEAWQEDAPWCEAEDSKAPPAHAHSGHDHHHGGREHRRHGPRAA
jgi:zinc/manganese transport system ATP-binding protein